MILCPDQMGRNSAVYRNNPDYLVMANIYLSLGQVRYSASLALKLVLLQHKCVIASILWLYNDVNVII